MTLSKSRNIVLIILLLSVLISVAGIITISIKLYNIHKGDSYIEGTCDNIICKFIDYTSNKNSNYNITLNIISICGNKSEIIVKNMIISVSGNDTYCNKIHHCYYKCPNVLLTLTTINPKKEEPASLIIALCIFMMIIGCLPMLLVPWRLGFPCVNEGYEKL